MPRAFDEYIRTHASEEDKEAAITWGCAAITFVTKPEAFPVFLAHLQSGSSPIPTEALPDLEKMRAAGYMLAALARVDRDV